MSARKTLSGHPDFGSGRRSGSRRKRDIGGKEWSDCDDCDAPEGNIGHTDSFIHFPRHSRWNRHNRQTARKRQTRAELSSFLIRASQIAIARQAVDLRLGRFSVSRGGNGGSSGVPRVMTSTDWQSVAAAGGAQDNCKVTVCGTAAVAGLYEAGICAWESGVADPSYSTLESS
jgi:hypothetical protein